MNRWRTMVAAGVLAAAATAAGTAAGTPLDVASLEGEVRREVFAFGVASGREEASPERLAELDTELLAALARSLRAAGDDVLEAVFGELERRDLPAKDRGKLVERLLMWWWGSGGPKPGKLQSLAEKWGRALWEDWEAGAFAEEERPELVDAVESVCVAMWHFPGAVPDGEREIWHERFASVVDAAAEWRRAQADAWETEMDAAAEEEESEQAAERTRRTAAAESAGGGEAERRLRRGMDLAKLGRLKDASAEWHRAAEVAERAGDAERAREARALLAGRGDWAWRRGKRRALCEAEIATGSPWSEYLRGILGEMAEEEGRFDEALLLALEGWLDYGTTDWERRAVRAAALQGGRDVDLLQQAAGEVLENTPPAEERRGAIKRLLLLRWALGEFYPGHAEKTLEADFEGLRERAAAAENGEKGGDTAADESRTGRPGERWEGAEPSWRTDGAFPEIERELNELLSRPDADAEAAWRAKWSLEERRALRVNGAGGEFALLAKDFLSWGLWQDDWKELGKRVLEEFKAQDGYDGKTLLEVLAAMGEASMAGDAADPAELASWVDWARRVAAGDPLLEGRVAVLEACLAHETGDETTMRRLAAGDTLAFFVCPGPPGSLGGPWKLLLRGADERKAAELALLRVRMTRPEMAADAMALLDVMTPAELEAFRDASWMRILAGMAWEPSRAWWEDLAELCRVMPGNVEAQLRLARLEEQGAECGEEGLALALELGPAPRGVSVALKARMTAGATADGAEEDGGRWAEWCAAVRRVAFTCDYGGGERWVFSSGECIVASLPPWMDRMALRRLREALAEWGRAATPPERQAVASALEALGERAPEALLDNWRAAAAAAGEWASDALERGRERGERARAAEAERLERMERETPGETDEESDKDEIEFL